MKYLILAVVIMLVGCAATRPVQMDPDVGIDDVRKEGVSHG